VEDAFLIVQELSRGGFDVITERVESAAAMQAALEEQTWDLIISDYSIPGFGGPAALELYQQEDLDIPLHHGVRRNGRGSSSGNGKVRRT